MWYNISGDVMEPLAIKLRPEKLKDVIGQKHLIGKDKILSNLVKNKKVFSMILHGKPGIGKTTIATSIVNELGLNYRMLNATINNKKDFDIVVEEAKMYGELVLIMDEIHRLNKDKQDLLLPYLEQGTIILIGLTTANPYHSINPAIRSRCQIFELHELTKEDIIAALNRAKKVLDNIKIKKTAIDYIANVSSGDLRFAYNLLEVAYYSTKEEITIDLLKSISNKPNIFHDKNGDGYYDVISAFQKSIRGSDVDAALHYLARLIEAEDACINACERLGLPEARIPLAQTVIELALSPKSNSAISAIDEALNDLEKGNTGNVPNHIKTT